MIQSNVFKIRCELITDAFTFLTEFFRQTVGQHSSIQIDKSKYLCCELTLTTRQSLTFVKNIIEGLPNLHCMLQTVEPIENYTGIRK